MDLTGDSISGETDGKEAAKKPRHIIRQEKTMKASKAVKTAEKVAGKAVVKAAGKAVGKVAEKAGAQKSKITLPVLADKADAKAKLLALMQEAMAEGPGNNRECEVTVEIPLNAKVDVKKIAKDVSGIQ